MAKLTYLKSTATFQMHCMLSTHSLYWYYLCVLKWCFCQIRPNVLNITKRPFEYLTFQFYILPRIPLCLSRLHVRTSLSIIIPMLALVMLSPSLQSSPALGLFCRFCLLNSLPGPHSMSMVNNERVAQRLKQRSWSQAPDNISWPVVCSPMTDGLCKYKWTKYSSINLF